MQLRLGTEKDFHSTPLYVVVIFSNRQGPTEECKQGPGPVPPPFFSLTRLYNQVNLEKFTRIGPYKSLE